MKNLVVATLAFFTMTTSTSAMNHHLKFTSDFLHDQQVNGTLGDYKIDIYHGGVLINTIDPPAGSIWWPEMGVWRHVITTSIPYSETMPTSILFRHLPTGISGEMSNGQIYGDECWEWDLDMNGVIGGSDYSLFLHQFDAGTASGSEYSLFIQHFGQTCT